MGQAAKDRHATPGSCPQNLGDVDENRDFRSLSHEIGILIAEKNERARPVAVVGSTAVKVIKRFVAA
jgi:hypothetical protein